jgi:hypothetical protein
LPQKSVIVYVSLPLHTLSEENQYSVLIIPLVSVTVTANVSDITGVPLVLSVIEIFGGVVSRVKEIFVAIPSQNQLVRRIEKVFHHSCKVLAEKL